MSEREKTEVIATAYVTMDDYMKGYLIGLADNEIRHQQERKHGDGRKEEQDGKTAAEPTAAVR